MIRLKKRIIIIIISICYSYIIVLCRFLFIYFRVFHVTCFGIWH